MTSLGQDRPVELALDDLLDRGPFVENLVRALVLDEKDLSGRLVARHATGVVVGLTGKWGSGKSTILHLLAQHLEAMDHVAVATFNPWLFKGRDELLAAFFNELRDALGRSPEESVRDAMTAVDRYRAAITAGGQVVAFAADTVLPAWVGKTILKILGWLKIITRPKDLSPQQERRALEKKLDAANVAVVVLIDELDRVEDDEVRAVAQLVKAVGDIKGVSYLVAYDPKRVAEALGRGDEKLRQATGEAYLEKIIQHPIPIRPLFAHDVAALFRRLLEHHGLQLPSDLTEDELAVVTWVQNAVETPRDLKRLIGAYAVLDRMLRQEVSAADLLGYCWLMIKAPSLREAIAHNIDAFVDDASSEELSRRVIERMEKRDPILDQALGAPPGAHEELLKLLFPRFGKSDREQSGHRLSVRRNLVRTLYLGDAPGIAKRETLEQLWSVPDVDALTLNLKLALANGELGGILDRLDDLLPKLPEGGDATFWRALTRALVRDHDWYLHPEPHHAYADDAVTYLRRLGMRDEKQVGRVKNIVAALVGDSDLVLVPAILRKHLFRWGLTHHDRSERSGAFIYDRTETQQLLDKTAPYFRAAILDGTLLRRLPHGEAMYALSNVDLWDEELRDSLTSQLDSYKARASFASLIVPPNHSADRSTLDRLIDAETVLARMKATGEGANANGTTWSDACLRRLRRSLQGKDTMFDDGDDED
jgi:hypothetical protein